MQAPFNPDRVNPDRVNSDRVNSDPGRSIGGDRSETTLEAALCRLDLERAMSALVTGALERIANGSYGRCVHCSGKIAPERLRALPWVRMCADCQDEHL